MVIHRISLLQDILAPFCRQGTPDLASYAAEQQA
jgi:hypothetical protein